MIFNKPVPKVSKCPLCLEIKELVKDHNHKTKMLRGLICYSCNNSLSSKWEDNEWRARALEYLKTDTGFRHSPYLEVWNDGDWVVRIELLGIVNNGHRRIVKQEDKEYDLLEDALAAYGAAIASNAVKEAKAKP